MRQDDTRKNGQLRETRPGNPTKTIPADIIVFERTRQDEILGDILRRMADYANFVQAEQPDRFIEEGRLEFDRDGYHIGVLIVRPKRC